MRTYCYRLWCNDEAAYVEDYATSEPVSCPNNGAHVINQARTAIIECPCEDVLTFTFQNNGAVLALGVQSAAYVKVPFDCEIMRCRVYGGPSGSVQVDLWVDTHTNYPPTVADTIVAAAPPSIVADVKSEDITLAGWTKALVQGDGILPNIDSVTNMTWVKIVLLVKRT